MLSRLLLIAAAALPGRADAPPAPPDAYDVAIRYQINASRNERVKQHLEMTRYFRDAGFVRAGDDVPADDEAENADYDRMRGTIPADKVRLLLGERHVRVLQLLPTGKKPPDDANARVRVDVELASGLPLERQRRLADQTLRVLRVLGFQEAVAYDSRGNTRLLGSIPAGKLGDLFGDLRRQPAAWSLIAGSPLNDLRGQPGGADAVEDLLLTWYDTPKGKELLLPILDEWQRRPAGEEFVRRQPAVLFSKIDERTNKPDLTLLHERLLGHIAHHPDAADLLDKLLAAVVASPEAPALLDPLLTRLLSSGVGKTLPVFFRTPSPVAVVEVRPDLPVPSARPPAPAVPKELEKVGPELRDLQDKADPARLEVILTRTPADGDRRWYALLKAAAPELVVEGRLGPLVTVRAALNQAKALAALPDVAAVRLPRVARPRLEAAEAVEGWEPLRASGVAKLHAMNRKGRGTRVAVIDGDFSGWRGLVGKQLPGDTLMVDLTAERNDDVQPDPDPGDGKTLGHGVHMALAVLRAAPEAELVLVRIDPAAPYMLQEVARAMNGETLASESLDDRRVAFAAVRFLLDQQAAALRDERRRVLKQFADVTQKDVLLKKKEKGALTADEEEQLKEIQELEEYEKRQADWDRRDREYHEAMGRYLGLEQNLIGLKTVRVAASGLVWNEGHPVDESSAPTRYFEDQPFGAALWFQAAGDARGQAWSGLFRDEDGDGVMEFDSARGSPNDSLWARQLDFLSWAPDAPPPNPPPQRGEGRVGALDLPAGARARISLQWREAHDPEAGRPGEDPYLKPLADLRIVVLYQPGGNQASDDLEVVAQSAGPPQRLEATPSSAVYEQTVTLPVARAGRYAVRIEGAAPASTRPREDPTIPAARKTFELRPRLFVETLEGPGRVLLHDFVTEAGTLGMPADSRSLITVGAADSHGLPQPYSAGGPPLDVALLAKPDVLAYDQVEDGKDAAQGTGVATGFAAGVAAAARGLGSPRAATWRESMGVEPGGVVHAPK